jgi:hypothetical protein
MLLIRYAFDHTLLTRFYGLPSRYLSKKEQEVKSAKKAQKKRSEKVWRSGIVEQQKATGQILATGQPRAFFPGNQY